MDADGGNQMNLTNYAATSIVPPGRRTAAKIAFVSDRDGGCEVYVMDADGGNPTTLPTAPRSTQSPPGVVAPRVGPRVGNPKRRPTSAIPGRR